MKYIILLLLFIHHNLLFSQDEDSTTYEYYYEEGDNANPQYTVDENTYYYEESDNKSDAVDENTYYYEEPQYTTDVTESDDYDTEQAGTNPSGNLTLPPSYKTFNTRTLRSIKLPELFTSHTVLENLNQTYWKLKFYNHQDIKNYSTMDLAFTNNIMNITLINNNTLTIETAQYKLMPQKMLKPSEGIFVHVSKDEKIIFVYIRLVLQNMLAVKITENYEEAEAFTKSSMADLPLFFIQ